MAIKPQPGRESRVAGQRPAHAETRVRTCKACGEDYEYPIRGEPATRNHCAPCAALPSPTRKVLEKLQQRIARMEKELARLRDA